MWTRTQLVLSNSITHSMAMAYSRNWPHTHYCALDQSVVLVINPDPSYLCGQEQRSLKQGIVINKFKYENPGKVHNCEI